MDVRSILAVSKASYTTNLGLLFLRVSFGLSLFVKHGFEKITRFGRMVAGFPDPFHIGAPLSLSIATASDVFAAVFLVIGFSTRPAAFFVACNILVAWLFVHHGMFFGKDADHGEVCVLYICGFVSVPLCGPGRYSVDALLTARF
ncbi:DoxX family protein [Granulicella arctica]|uniref:DoxX family protein n=1 Tax=Granulicella arctica TaxID=940613 RepID=UPI0021E0E982|nr:DoxX family protein [Granulicella arctica]